MKEVVDENQRQKTLQILKEIADNKTPETLSANYASKISESFRQQTAENLKLMKSFAYLGNEKITTDHFIPDPNATEIFHYKMTLANKTVYYHFRINKDGKIGWIIFED